EKRGPAGDRTRSIAHRPRPTARRMARQSAGVLRAVPAERRRLSLARAAARHALVVNHLHDVHGTWSWSPIHFLCAHSFSLAELATPRNGQCLADHLICIAPFVVIPAQYFDQVAIDDFGQ